MLQGKPHHQRQRIAAPCGKDQRKPRRLKPAGRPSAELLPADCHEEQSRVAASAFQNVVRLLIIALH
jgi:hypothetical protein